jgi:phage repressor protein C with HTH and peptisase S24 domain
MMRSELISERIKKIRTERGVTQEGLAEILGVNRNTVGNWEKGKRKPNSDMIMSIAQKLDTSASYLLGETDDLGLLNATIVTPDGAIRQVTDELLAKARQREIKSDLATLNPHHRTVVRVLPKDFAACCGDGVNWETNTVGFEYEYIDPDPDLTRFSPVIAMHVIGDSMEPDIEEGDMVLFTENSSDVEYASNGSIAVVNYDGRMIVRGLFKRNDRIVLKAWNKDYDDIELTPDDEFRVCGIVLRVDKSKRPRSML